MLQLNIVLVKSNESSDDLMNDLLNSKVQMCPTPSFLAFSQNVKSEERPLVFSKQSAGG